MYEPKEESEDLHGYVYMYMYMYVYIARSNHLT